MIIYDHQISEVEYGVNSTGMSSSFDVPEIAT